MRARPVLTTEPSQPKPIRSRRARDTSLVSSKPEAKPNSQPTPARDLGGAGTSTEDVKEQTSKQLSFGDLYILQAD